MTRRNVFSTNCWCWDARGGDCSAFESLVARWQPRFERHAWRLTGCRDAVPDIVQEAWLAVVQGIHRLDDPACFPRWAYRIVTNKCADWTRRLQRDRKAKHDIARQFGEISSSAGNDSGAEVESLHQALESLSGDQRAMLTMFYQDGLSIAAIAEVLSIPEGTVKSRLHHARIRLKKLLERKMP
jgi:RNA polymerase sigma-70 factor (ECF subfamily)